MKRILVFFLSFSILFTACAAENNVNQENREAENSKERIIAAWVYYNEIEDLVEAANTEDDFYKSVTDVVVRLSEYSVNTLILHVRAFDDAFYNSQYFPVSSYCDDADENLKFDVLQCFSKICHEKNIKLWCWINPYRINKVNDISVIKEGYFQYEALYSAKSQMIIRSENGVYYNPADREVQKHIIDGVREILDNYDVDGIHFDDYFYPGTDTSFDSDYYDNYKNDGGELSLSDFRRANVNSLISSVYAVTKMYGKVFSVSPASDIEKNYNSYYADVRIWATSDSYVDYIIPQIYFGFQNPVQPFKETLEKWVDLTGDSSKLLVGLAVYKSGTSDTYAKSGKDEWKSRDVISKEIDLICKNYENIGFVYYSASFLYKMCDEGTEIEKINIKNVLNLYLPTYVT